MQNFEPYQLWMLMAAVAYIAFLIGRATARRSASDGSQDHFFRQQVAEETFNSLPLSKREEVDRLLRAGKLISAVKVVREETNAGLKDSKAMVDGRKRTLKAAAQ